MVEMSAVNKPEVSGPLAWLYIATAVLLAALGALITYLYVQTQKVGAIVGLVVVVAVEIIIISIVVSMDRTEYTLTQRELIMRASVFIGGTKRVSLETIESVERTLIPFGIRLFGATGYGGYYYFPSIGKTFVVITNFRDGVLIKTKQGNFLITPKNPDDFIESIKRMAKPEKVGS
ncbi:MAG: PH domain-containing protein [Candidatus Bathyarchaeia archaeon]|jgi:hypothetical protein